MAQLNNFDANEVQPFEGFEAVPAGKYLAMIVESEMEATKAGDGSFLKLTFEIIEGKYKGRKVWDRLNLNHPNPDAVRIAQGKLSAICRVVGVMTPNDSSDLHNLPLLLTVKCRKRDDNGDLVNDIKKYEKKGEGTAPPSQDVGNTAPWKR